MRYGGQVRVSLSPPSLATKHNEGSLPARSELIDEVVELVGSVAYLHPDDLLRILKAGYRNMTRFDRDEFMRKSLLELKKSVR